MKTITETSDELHRNTRIFTPAWMPFILYNNDKVVKLAGSIRTVLAGFQNTQEKEINIVTDACF